MSGLKQLFGLVVLAPLAVLALASAGCNESSLQQLRPGFAIEWPEDQGYSSEEFESSRLLFGTVTTGEIATIPISVSNPGTADLELCETYLAVATFDENGDLASEVVVAEDPELASSGPAELLVIDNGAVLQFELRFTPLYGTELADNLHLVVKHELNWSCSDDEGTGLYIPIDGEGFGEPVPDIHSKPDSVEFPDTEVGQSSAVYDVRVTNLGPGLLTIDDIFLEEDTHFTITEESVAGSALNQGDNALFSVQFTPTSAGTQSTEVLVLSNDPDEPTYSIPLVGVANDGEVGKGPQAICGPDFDSAPFMTESYDGSGSFDSDGLTLTYQWVLTPPAGSASGLSSYSVPSPSISLDLAGDYVGELTVTNTNGQTDSCTQTITAIPNENFRVELFWAVPDDMDLHLLRPDSQGGATPHSQPGDCYYANTNPDWGVTGVGTDDPGLDLDDIYGTGPENINIADPAVGSNYEGWYEVFVHDYPWTEIYEAANDTTVNIYLNGVLAQTFNFQISGEDADYYVAKIHWPSGNIQACNGLAGCP